MRWRLPALLAYCCWRVVGVGMAVASKVPASPCPRVFRYQRRAASWGAIVTIPAPPPDVPLILRIELSVPAALPTRLNGSLQLQEGRRALLARLAARDQRPVRYSLQLPAGVPLPELIRITAMGRELCRVRQDTRPERIYTTISLEHTIRPEPVRLFMQTNDNGDGDENNTSTSYASSVTPEVNLSEDEIDDTCGEPVPLSRLVAVGEAVSPGSWPWLVAVFTATPLGLEFHCAGTLVSAVHVVTAAHCVHQRAPDELLVSVGRQNVRKWTESQAQSRDVGRVLVHPDFVAASLTSDLAVLELMERVSYDWFTRPACIDWEASADLDAVVGQLGTVVGWGRDERGRRLTPEPRAARMPIVTQEACLRSRADFVHVTSERTFCAGFRNGSGPCNGDSGSGLLLPSGGGRWTLRGVVSLSLLDGEHLTCDLHHYVVFTDVAKFRVWLGSIVQTPDHKSQRQSGPDLTWSDTKSPDLPVWDSDPDMHHTHRKSTS